DAKRQGEDGDGGEPWSPAERAQRVGQVLADAVGEREAARVAALFLAHFDGAHVAKCGEPRRVGRQPSGDVLLDEALEMVLELLAELVLDPAPPEQRPQAETQQIRPAHGVLTSASRRARWRRKGGPTGRFRPSTLSCRAP